MIIDQNKLKELQMNIASINSLDDSARDGFQIAGTRPLMLGEDEAFQRLEAIYSISTLIARAYSDSRQLGDKSEIDNLNQEIVRGAWEGVALLAADASFALYRAA